MRDQNTKDKTEFIISHVYWALIIMIWYRNLLFRCIDSWTYRESKLVLWGCVVVASVVGICLSMRRNRNSVSVFADIVFGYGVYAIATYMDIRHRMIVIILSIATLLSIAYALMILCHKIKKRTNFKKIILRRISRAAIAARTLYSAGLLCIIVILVIGGIFGDTILNASVKPASSENIDEWTIANNIDTILQLQESEWEQLSVDERLDVLQTVANIEVRYLGISTELNVGAAELREELAGYYSDSTHEIVVSLEYLKNGSAHENLDTLCHEVRHAYQHRLIDAYKNANESDANLLVFRDAKQYQLEFTNYVDGKEDICEYYTQSVEVDARSYARESVNEYYRRIMEYVMKNEYGGY